MERGEIHSRGRRKQIMRFANMRYGNITPTDIDGLIEYKNKCYVMWEVKYGDIDLPYGQKLALTRLIDDLIKPAVLLVSRHRIHDVNEDVDVSTTVVDWAYFNGTWVRLKEGKKLKEVTDAFLEKYG